MDNHEDIMRSEISQSQKPKSVFLRLYEVLRVVKITETGSRRMVARGRGVGDGELAFHGDRISVRQGEEL